MKSDPSKPKLAGFFLSGILSLLLKILYIYLLKNNDIKYDDRYKAGAAENSHPWLW